MKNKILKKLSFVILGLIIVSLVFMASFFMSSYSPNSMAMDNLENSQLVDVTVDDFITFTPENVTATKGLIIHKILLSILTSKINYSIIIIKEIHTNYFFFWSSYPDFWSIICSI